MDVETIIDELEKADNDNKKFALLLIVSKLIKEDKLDKCNKQLNEKLFMSISPHFLARLLTSTQVPANCDKSIYKSISMSILVQFVDYKHLITDPIILSKIKVIISQLESSKECLKSSDSECVETNRHLIENIFKYFFALTDQCSNHLCKNGLLEVLLGKYMLDESDENTSGGGDFRDISFQLFSKIVQFDTINKYECKDDICGFLKEFLFKLDKLQTESKFHLIKYLNSLLDDQNLSLYFDVISDYSIEILLSLLKDLHKSKLKQNFKDDAILLLANYLKKYENGLSYMHKTDKKFFYLIVHLIAIEIRLNLEDNYRFNLDEMIHNDIFITKMSILYDLFEKFVIYLAISEDIDINNESEQVNNILKLFIETINSIITFVNDCLKEKAYEKFSNFLLLIATIRVLSCWFSYEEILENEIIDIAGKIIQFCDFYVQKTENNAIFINVYQFLIPGLTRFISNNGCMLDMLTVNSSTSKIESFDHDLFEKVESVKAYLDHCNKMVENVKK